MRARLFALVLTLLTVPAFAGTVCEPARLAPQAFLNAADLATKLKAALVQRQARVALVARAGADLSAYQLTYSHLALVVADEDRNWRVHHSLNHCARATSALFEHGLLEFFTDDPFEYKALIAIPNEPTQRALLAFINEGHASAMHEQHYNMIANPFSTRYQNSNQWVLEVLVAARQGAPASRAHAQKTLRRVGYKPQWVTIDPLKRLGASMFKANIRFVDHPLSVRLGGVYPVVSVRSVIDYAKRSQLLSDMVELSL